MVSTGKHLIALLITGELVIGRGVGHRAGTPVLVGLGAVLDTKRAGLVASCAVAGVRALALGWLITLARGKTHIGKGPYLARLIANAVVLTLVVGLRATVVIDPERAVANFRALYMPLLLPIFPARAGAIVAVPKKFLI